MTIRNTARKYGPTKGVVKGCKTASPSDNSSPTATQTHPPTGPPSRMLRLNEVCVRTGLARDSIYRLAKLGKFPKPVKVSDWASRWHEHEVDKYIAERTAERDARAAS